MDLPVEHVVRPPSLEEALAALAADPLARPIAGGTDLVVQLRDGRRRTATLVDLGRSGLTGIRTRDGRLEIGACTPMDVIAADPGVREICPSLAEAAGLIGAWPNQCRATLGGNLANASPAADTAPPLLVAEASLRLVSRGGRREVPAAHFFRGPGETCLAAGEIIEAILVPLWKPDAERTLDRFAKVGPRREQIISAVSLAARIAVRAGAVSDVRLALGATAPTPVRARMTESFLLGRAPTATVRREACVVLQRDIAPIDDVRAPAAYRRVAAAVLLDRSLAEVAGG